LRSGHIAGQVDAIVLTAAGEKVLIIENRIRIENKNEQIIEKRLCENVETYLAKAGGTTVGMIMLIARPSKVMREAKSVQKCALRSWSFQELNG